MGRFGPPSSGNKKVDKKAAGVAGAAAAMPGRLQVYDAAPKAKRRPMGAPDRPGGGIGAANQQRKRRPGAGAAEEPVHGARGQQQRGRAKATPGSQASLQSVRQHDLERHMLAHASDGDSSPEKERQHRAKLEAARAVGYRESLLMQLNAVVIHWPKKSDKGSGPGASNRHEEAARLLENLSGELREAGMACVEKIVAWVLAVSEHASRPKPFWWNGKDYLVKMFSDLDFVSETIGDEAWRIGNFCHGNPLLLTRQEINGEGPKAEVARIHAASMVILDVIRRNPAGKSRAGRPGQEEEEEEAKPETDSPGAASTYSELSRSQEAAAEHATAAALEKAAAEAASMVVHPLHGAKAAAASYASVGPGGKAVKKAVVKGSKSRQAAAMSNLSRPTQASKASKVSKVEVPTHPRGLSKPQAAPAKPKARATPVAEKKEANSSSSTTPASASVPGGNTGNTGGTTTSSSASEPTAQRSHPQRQGAGGSAQTGPKIARTAAGTGKENLKKGAAASEPKKAAVKREVESKDAAPPPRRSPRLARNQASANDGKTEAKKSEAKIDVAVEESKPAPAAPAESKVEPKGRAAAPALVVDEAKPGAKQDAEPETKALEEKGEEEEDVVGEEEDVEEEVEEETEEAAEMEVASNAPSSTAPQEENKQTDEAEEEEEEEDDYEEDYEVTGEFEDLDVESKEEAKGEQEGDDEEMKEEVDAMAEEEEDEDNIESLPMTPPKPKDRPEDWVKGKQLGEGAYGDVYLVHHRRSGVRGAMKVFKSGEDDEEDDEETKAYVRRCTSRELDIVRKLRHPNIVDLLAAFDTAPPDGQPMLVFELMDCNALEMLEKYPQGMGLDLTRRVGKQLTSALAYCHAQGVVHRDLKPENLLVKDPKGPDLSVKLCDFGASRFLGSGAKRRVTDPHGMTNYVGSRWYRAPESLGSLTDYNEKFDVWGLGCLLGEFATGANVFDGDDEEALAKCILGLLGEPPSAVRQNLASNGDIVLPTVRSDRKTPEERLARYRRGLGDAGVGLLAKLLAWDPAARPSCEEALAHAYFSAASTNGSAAEVAAPEASGKDGQDKKVEAAEEEVDDENLEPVGDDDDDDDYGDDDYDESGFEDMSQSQPATARSTKSNQSGPAASALPETEPTAEEEEEESEEDKAELEFDGGNQCWDRLKRYPKSRDLLRDIAAGSHNMDDVTAAQSAGEAVDTVDRTTLLDWAQAFAGSGSDGLAKASAGEGEGAGVVAAERVIDALQGAIDNAVQGAVRSIRDWMVSQQRADLTIVELVDALDTLEPVPAPDSKALPPSSSQRCLVPQASECIAAAEVLERIHRAHVASSSSSSTPGSPEAAGGRSRKRKRTISGAGFHSMSLNCLVASVSTLLLDTEVGSETKATGLQRLESALGLFPLRSHPCLLTPASKAVLLHMDLTLQRPSRLTLTTTRSETLETCMRLLDSCNLLDEPSGGWRNADPDSPAGVVICPYYKSPFGKKVQEGHTVEEGEGLGPRKELFSLIAAQLQRKWRPAGSVVVSYEAGSNIIDVHDLDSMATTAAASNDGSIAGCQLVFRAPVPANWSALDDAGVADEANAGSHGGTVQPGKSGGPAGDAVPTRQVVQVMGDGQRLRLDRPLQKSGTRETIEIQRRYEPALLHHRNADALWLNPGLKAGPANERLLRFLGYILGSTVTNQCHLDLRLPLGFFQAILDPQWRPSVQDMLAFDPSFQQTLSMIRGLSLEAFRDVLLADGVDPPSDFHTAAGLERAKESYLNSSVLHFFGFDDTGMQSWAFDEIRCGFQLAVPPTVVKSLEMTPEDLQEILCGTKDDVTEDFDFRATFQVVMDPELQSCTELHDAFWDTIDGLTPLDKRRFLLFVTGVSKLPPRGSEFMTVEMPFLPFGLDDQRKILLMVPQSHTCDNILELPNYWDALRKVRSAERGSSVPPEELVPEVRAILRDKIQVAIDNAQGYALDSVDDQGAVAGVGGAMPNRDGLWDDDDDSDDEGPRQARRGAAASSMAEQKDDDDAGDFDIPQIPDIDDIPSLDAQGAGPGLPEIPSGPSSGRARTPGRRGASRGGMSSEGDYDDDYEDDYEDEGFDESTELPL